MAERTYPRAAVLIEAGRAAFDWVEDTGECLFCNLDNNKAHEDFCVFRVEASPLNDSPVVET